MGKNKSIKNKSFKKKAAQFMKSNRVLLASIIGATAGFAITLLMGTRKVKKLMRSAGTELPTIPEKIREGAKERIHALAN